MKRSNRKLIGNPPVDEAVLIAQANGWQMYHRTAASSEKFKSVKLISEKALSRKANYHLGWNIEKKTLTGGREHALLREYFPGVCEWVKQVLSNSHFS